MPLHFLSISDKLSAMKRIYPNLIAEFILSSIAIILTDTAANGIDKNARRANSEIFEKMTAVFFSQSDLDI